MKLFSSKPKVKKPRTVGVFREYFELIAETLVFVFFVMTFLLQSFVIPTGSMEDTLLIGDHLLVDKVAYSRSLTGLERLLLPQTPIQRGMIVTFKPPPIQDGTEDPANAEVYREWCLNEDSRDLRPYPVSSNKEYVKRVIGLPGETIRIEDRKVYINGTLLDEPYTYFKKDRLPVFPPADEYGWQNTFPYRFRRSIVITSRGPAFKIPPDYYFCMGDNRDNSLDCRYWGPVPAVYVIGKPWRIYWSYDSTSGEYLPSGIAPKVRDLFRTFLHFFSRTRWNRTIKKVS